MSFGDVDLSGESPAAPEPEHQPLHLHRWTDPAVLGIALCAFAAGFGQYSVVAALGNVARAFGHQVGGTTITEQAGLSGTDIGVGLAVIRFASMGGLVAAGLADRWGRRWLLITTVVVGLAFTAASAASPGYWWFVCIFALGRPALTATNTVAQVAAAEQTSVAERAKAVGLIAAAYALGAGVIAVLNGLFGHRLGFRVMFELALVPLAMVLFAKRWITEPDRYLVAAATSQRPAPVLGAIGRHYVGRVAILALLAFSVAVVTGPANSFVFLYAQNVLHLPGWVTSSMVVASGAVGLGGLVVGRFLADRWGRRPTCALAMAGIAASATFAYSGPKAALVIGYIAGVVCGAVFAPGAGAMLNELFPTSVRASAAGWDVAAGVLGAVVGLVAFGALADAKNGFSNAALTTFVPTVAAIALFLALPETKGREPEDLWLSMT